MNEDLEKLHKSKNYDEIYNLIETKFSQFESRWNSVLASEEGVKLYRNTKLSDNNRDTIYRKMFTELIVKECISCCEEIDDINKAYREGLFLDPELGPKECINTIKARFGFKE